MQTLEDDLNLLVSRVVSTCLLSKRFIHAETIFIMFIDINKIFQVAENCIESQK